MLDDILDTPDSDKPEHLLRLFRETMLDQIRSNRSVTARVDGLDKEVSTLSSLVRNQSKALSDQFAEIHKKLSDRSEETDTALMEIARELASIRRDHKEEAEARKRQDSIHEEEVTGVKHEIAIVKSEASYAVRTLAVLKETVTTKNVVKGTFLAIVVSAIEAVVKNWDKIFP